MSELDPELINKYRTANYQVRDATRCITFRIDRESQDLDHLLDTHDTRTAAFITAHNPHSRVSSSAENDLAHKKLLIELSGQGLCWLSGEGGDLQGRWIPETSVLIFGLNRSASTALAKRFGQNAYVWVQRGESPRLVLTHKQPHSF